MRAVSRLCALSVVRPPSPSLLSVRRPWSINQLVQSISAYPLVQLRSGHWAQAKPLFLFSSAPHPPISLPRCPTSVLHPHSTPARLPALPAKALHMPPLSRISCVPLPKWHLLFYTKPRETASFCLLLAVANKHLPISSPSCLPACLPACLPPCQATRRPSALSAQTHSPCLPACLLARPATRRPSALCPNPPNPFA